MRCKWLLASIAALCVFSTAASAGIVALNGGTMALTAQQGNPFVYKFGMAPQGPTYPQSQTGSATAGNSYGSATYTIDSNLITLTSSFHRDGSFTDISKASVISAFGSLNFTVDQDSYYSLSGEHALTGGQRVSMQVIFDDVTTGVRCFRNYQYSENSLNEVLTLGQPTGEHAELTGDIIGPLVAGHRYSLSFNYQIANPLGADGGASSVGNLYVTLCPEPGSALLLVLGALATVRRR